MCAMFQGFKVRYYQILAIQIQDTAQIHIALEIIKSINISVPGTS